MFVLTSISAVSKIVKWFRFSVSKIRENEILFFVKSKNDLRDETLPPPPANYDTSAWEIEIKSENRETVTTEDHQAEALNA